VTSCHSPAPSTESSRGVGLGAWRQSVVSYFPTTVAGCCSLGVFTSEPSSAAVLTAVVTLPVTVIDHGTYLSSIKAAERRIGRRDPDGVGVVWYTTAELLAVLDRG